MDDDAVSLKSNIKTWHRSLSLIRFIVTIRVTNLGGWWNQVCATEVWTACKDIHELSICSLCYLMLRCRLSSSYIHSFSCCQSLNNNSSSLPPLVPNLGSPDHSKTLRLQISLSSAINLFASTVANHVAGSYIQYPFSLGGNLPKMCCNWESILHEIYRCWWNGGLLITVRRKANHKSQCL